MGIPSPIALYGIAFVYWDTVADGALELLWVLGFGR
jgi:hypothetical protein